MPRGRPAEKRDNEGVDEGEVQGGDEVEHGQQVLQQVLRHPELLCCVHSYSCPKSNCNLTKLIILEENVKSESDDFSFEFLSGRSG